jgi:hypothetical protein
VLLITGLNDRGQKEAFEPGRLAHNQALRLRDHSLRKESRSSIGGFRAGCAQKKVASRNHYMSDLQHKQFHRHTKKKSLSCNMIRVGTRKLQNRKLERGLFCHSGERITRFKKEYFGRIELINNDMHELIFELRLNDCENDLGHL